MPKSYIFSEGQIAELTEARKKNKDKHVDKRLEALLLRAAKVSRTAVAEKTGFCKQYITDLTANYQQNGLCAIVENHCGGNHRNMSFDEETALLEPFLEEAKAGKQIDVSAILKAYEHKLGRSCSKDHGRIYRVLERHGWRKVMPRSKHPQKADDEAIDASKKLTLVSKKWKWEILTASIDRSV
jgi:transposase